MAYDTVVLDGDCTLLLPESADVSLTVVQDGECGVVTKVKEYEYYTGATEITPSAETQVLPTAGLAIPGDITINPIPQNYGLITWNGLGIRVS